MGFHMRTGVAIDDAIHTLLVAAGIPRDIGEECMPAQGAKYDHECNQAMMESDETWVGLCRQIRSIQLDTGANGTFLYTDVEPYLYDKAASNVTIGTANNGKLHGNMRGKLKAQVLNVAGYMYDGLQPSVPFDIAATTVPKIGVAVC